ncbi:MAG: hypothetical protein Q7W55_04465 [Pseudohongiella sp.]|nr:hypothetical protein [Pseudohongiella sp.]MDO9521910.1 hypothetical protein [Pseudohongiella sp.]MDP2128545.1 hypothetical protein [Pseudohongiella sp.]
MLSSELLPILFFLLLMLAGLMLAAWAARLQAVQYHTLRQLTSLEQRREHIQEAARALQRMDTDADVLAILFGALAEDLRQMQGLDPTRKDLDKPIQEAEAAARQKSGSPQTASGGSAAVATEQELSMAQRQIQKALGIFNELYRADKISAGQLESSRSKLRVLGMRVAVNSCLLMAQQSMEQEDAIRAMSCYRRAESLLHMRGIPPAEKQEKLAYIAAERARVFERTNTNAGLLMLATPD